MSQLLRFYPFYKGRGSVVFLKQVQEYLHTLPSPMCVTIYDGQKLFIDPCDYIGSMIYLYQDLDPSISWCLKKCLNEGDIFVDVGANIGIESIPAAKLVGNTGHIHSFEPNTKVNILQHFPML
ncbi:MAG: hypothetical protein ACKO3K_15645 [Cuspidothrix sp.]